MIKKGITLALAFLFLYEFSLLNAQGNLQHFMDVEKTWELNYSALQRSIIYSVSGCNCPQNLKNLKICMELSEPPDCIEVIDYIGINGFFVADASTQPILNRKRARYTGNIENITNENISTFHIPADGNVKYSSSGLPETDRTLLSLQTVLPGDPMELYIRSVLAGHSHNTEPSFLIRPFALKGNEELFYGNHGHAWSSHPFFRELEAETYSEPVKFFLPHLYYSHNNKRAAGFNDGALWQGRGANVALSAGISAHNGPVRAVIRPVLVYSENREFALSTDPPYPGISPYGMALTYADIPQRFGDGPVSRVDLGDSFVEFERSWFSGGFSNQRMWTGPAVHNPLMFSTNAPGFLHVYAGTSRPYSIPGGSFEARMFWGGLRESEYFDEDPDNNIRYLTGFVVSYSPGFLKGLHVGMTRVSYSYYNGKTGVSDVFMAFRRSSARPDADEEDFNFNDVHFTKGSFFLRWAYPRAGFEAYMEWGRNDDKRTLRNFLMEPELNRGYVLGVIQRIPVGRFGSILLNGEITNLENSSVTAQFRDANIWYANEMIPQGFTHRGQVLGAAIGPGSSTQVATVSYYHRYGMVGISLARIAMHNDRLFTNREYYHSTLPRDWMDIDRIHEVEIRNGFHGLFFLPWNIELQADLYSGKIENRYNDFGRPFPGTRDDDIFFDERNIHMSITLRYRTGAFLR